MSERDHINPRKGRLRARGGKTDPLGDTLAVSGFAGIGFGEKLIHELADIYRGQQIATWPERIYGAEVPIRRPLKQDLRIDEAG
jgi:hypothetical protein